MTENPKEKKGVFAKIKENIDDKEEQIALFQSLSDWLYSAGPHSS